MSGESDERCTAAMRRPKVVGVAKTDMAHGKACRLQAFANELLAAGIFGRDGRAGIRSCRRSSVGFMGLISERLALYRQAGRLV